MQVTLNHLSYASVEATRALKLTGLCGLSDNQEHTRIYIVSTRALPGTQDEQLAIQ